MLAACAPLFWTDCPVMSRETPDVVARPCAADTCSICIVESSSPARRTASWRLIPLSVPVTVTPPWPMDDVP